METKNEKKKTVLNIIYSTQGGKHVRELQGYNNDCTRSTKELLYFASPVVYEC